MDDRPLATSLDPLAGTPYRMIAPLGRGGMGEVLEAEHVHLEKRVVVKLLHKELADNPDVAGRLRSGALPVGEALGYVLQVLSGLAVAHVRGVMHRDIKLENVFLCRQDGAAIGPALASAVLFFALALHLLGRR